MRAYVRACVRACVRVPPSIYVFLDWEELLCWYRQTDSHKSSTSYLKKLQNLFWYRFSLWLLHLPEKLLQIALLEICPLILSLFGNTFQILLFMILPSDSGWYSYIGTWYRAWYRTRYAITLYIYIIYIILYFNHQMKNKCRPPSILDYVFLERNVSADVRRQIVIKALLHTSKLLNLFWFSLVVAPTR